MGSSGPEISAKHLGAHSQGKWGTPSPSHRPQNWRAWGDSAEPVGKTAGAQGHESMCHYSSPSKHTQPHEGPAPGGCWGQEPLLSPFWPELSPIQALFLAPEEEEKKAKKEVAVLCETLARTARCGPAGPENSASVGSKNLLQKRRGRGICCSYRGFTDLGIQHLACTEGLPHPFHILGSPSLQRR